MPRRGVMVTIRAMTPQEYVQEKAVASGSSFYYAFLFLPKPRRACHHRFLCLLPRGRRRRRRGERPDRGASQAGLVANRGGANRSRASRSHPVMQALMPCIEPFGIEEAQLQSVIEGCRMDLVQTRYLDFPALQRYCHLVAGVVGEVTARIFGQSDPRHHGVRSSAGPGVPAHQHHPRRRRRRDARPHLHSDERAAAVRREGARDPQPQVFRSLRRADEASRPSARIGSTTKRWRCCRPPTGAARSPD